LTRRGITTHPLPLTQSRVQLSCVKPDRTYLLARVLLAGLVACDVNQSPPPPAEAADTTALSFRNVRAATAQVGDAVCQECHVAESQAYAQHSMARSFHRWTPASRVERATDTPIRNGPTGYDYSVVDSGGQLYQRESLVDSTGRVAHALTRRIDYVMGSGRLARSYFTEENGRLFQLPLTWYASHGWDFSPGYQINNARFSRVLPDRCIACHSSYPTAAPHLEGKYPTLREGIGCERCHGPGALHVAQRRTQQPMETTTAYSIVNPKRLPLERRLDVCEQCHVHTAVSVTRDGFAAFTFQPSERLRDQVAHFKQSGSIDVVSHADRLRQSRCFLASKDGPAPLECATCHNPHGPPTAAAARNAPCRDCHADSTLRTRFAQSATLADHRASSDCVSCHMPKVQEQGVPHGTFTEHWIRRMRTASSGRVSHSGSIPIEPYFERDRDGPLAARYRAMGGIVYATLATDRSVLDTAARELAALLKSDRTSANAHFLLGVAESQFGRTGPAKAALTRAVQLDSTRPEPLRALAHVMTRGGGSAPEIQALYRRALAAQPALAWIRAEYAQALQHAGDADAAAREYRLALTEQPSLADAWFNYGTLLLERARADSAVVAFQRSVALDPALDAAVASLVALRTSGKKVIAARAVALPWRRLTAAPRRAASDGPVFTLALTDANTMRISNAPIGGYVLVSAPDGTLLLALPVGLDGGVTWDLRTGEGVPLVSGLYRADVQGRDLSGKPVPSQPLYFGIVRAAL
jgi:Tfp pilus assembly protein PilF